MSTKNVPHVMEEIGEVVRSIPQECDEWRTVEQIVYNQVPQIQEQVVMEVVQIIPRADVPVVL